MQQLTLKEKVEQEREKLQKREILLKMFPDLEETSDRWGNKRLFTKEANAVADEVDIHHSCGCCEDAGLLARPYKMVGGMKVFSDPCSFCIGQKAGFMAIGDEEYDNWQEKLKEAGIEKEEIYDKIKNYFKENKAKYPRWEEDEED